MMRSMYSGVSGLRIHQTKMDVIGNNIANVNTVGFKASRVTFGEVFSQTVQGASGSNESIGGTNPMQIGLGATISSIDIDMGEGAAQRTDNPLDLKIQGDGFFIVEDATGNKFTRAGAFKTDEAGNLVNSDGLRVMGWQTGTGDEANEIIKGTVEPIQILSADNSYSEPTATSSVTMSGNINMNDTALSNGTGVPFTANFYDSLGYQYSAQFTVKATGTNNQYAITLDENSITNSEGVTPTNLTNVAVTGVSTDGLIVFDTDGKVVVTDPSTSTFTLECDNPGVSDFDPILIDFSSLTLFDGTTTVKANVGNSSGLNAGNAAGTITGYEVGSDGQVVGKYSNGETKLLGQVVVAQFQNPAGLQKMGNNLFEATTNSGYFDGIGEDITSSGGSFNAGVLEMSNVDLSNEFTEMITTQRGFQANSRIITTSDELLQELVNLKR